MQAFFKKVLQVINTSNPNLEVVDVDITIKYWPLLALKCFTFYIYKCISDFLEYAVFYLHASMFLFMTINDQ
jgi:hypothetical protein